MKIKPIALFLLCLAVTGLQAQVDRSKMPKPGPAPEVNIGNPAQFQLDNGLKVIVVENHKLPRVSANLTIDNKPYAQGDKVGLKSLYSSMMGNGTQKMSKDEFNQKIDFLGANVGYGAQSARAFSLAKFFPEVFGLMAKGLLHPKFAQDEFEHQKKRAIEGIKSQQNNAGAIASKVDRALVYGKNHPYGEFSTVASVKRIDLSDIKTYYNNFITPNNAYLVVVGDIDVSKVKALVNKYFKNWTGGTPPSTTLPTVHDVQYTQVNFVNVSNAVQSEIAVMNPVHLKKTSDDYFAALMANQILGGGSDGRLFNDLREDKAYTYGAYSSLGSDRYVSDFKASASVRNAVTDSAVMAFLQDIKLIREKGVSKGELQLGKAKYSGSFVRALEHPRTIARYALNIQRYDLPKDYYRNYLKNLNAVTVAEVQQAAKKYFKVGHQRIVVVGKGSDVQKGLENLTFNGKSIPVKYFDKKIEPIEKPEYNKAVSADVTVASIYHDYIKAIGGEKAVEGVKTLYATYEGTMGGQSMDMTVKRTRDGKTLMKLGVGGMVLQKTVFDGEKGYTEARGQKVPFTDKQIQEYKDEAGIFPELKSGKEAKVSGIEKVDGQEAYVVKKEKQSVYYSVDSGLKIKIVTTTKRGAITTTFGDYKTVDGVKFPGKITRTLGPAGSVSFEVKDMQVNAKVSDADFQ